MERPRVVRLPTGVGSGQNARICCFEGVFSILPKFSDSLPEDAGGKA